MDFLVVVDDGGGDNTPALWPLEAANIMMLEDIVICC